ncbi:hypothetical protein [Paenibacillus durus]|uniref:hypothetical protein n=1 Tax=Paenibacillus durus TaxID=44251 RepID=UPI000ABAAD97|nr:hypothetical protein [Paenibacillus durus]
MRISSNYAARSAAVALNPVPPCASVIHLQPIETAFGDDGAAKQAAKRSLAFISMQGGELLCESLS